MSELRISNNSLPTVNDCDFCITTEPFCYAERTADYNVMIYVTEGVMYITEEDKDYEIHPGELLFLKKGLPHCVKKRIPRGTQWYYVHFYLNVDTELPTFIPSSNPMKQYEPIAYSISIPNYLKGLTGSNVEKSILSFGDYFHSDHLLREWNMNMYFYKLLTDISIYCKKIVTTPSLSDKICDYLTLHKNLPFSSFALEHHFSLSYKYMEATFKKDKQLTMQQYHTKLRMNSAGKLLKTTLLSVKEIGKQLGYSDQLYFSRCFHEFMGMSPSNYRKTQVSI